MFNFNDYLAMLEVASDTTTSNDTNTDSSDSKLDDVDIKDEDIDSMADDVKESGFKESYLLDLAILSMEKTDMMCSEQYIMRGVSREQLEPTLEASIKGAWESIKKFFKKIWKKIKSFFSNAKLYIMSVFMDTEKFYDKYKSEIDAKVKNLNKIELYVDFTDYSGLDAEMDTLKAEVEAFKKTLSFINEMASTELSKEEYEKKLQELDDNTLSSDILASKIESDAKISIGSTKLTPEIFNKEFEFFKRKKNIIKDIEDLEKDVDRAMEDAQKKIDRLKSDNEESEGKLRSIRYGSKSIAVINSKVTKELSIVIKLINNRGKQFNSILRTIIRNSNVKKESFNNYYGDGDTEFTIESIMKTF